MLAHDHSPDPRGQISVFSNVPREGTKGGGMTLYGVHRGILQVFIIILYENVFQNPAIFVPQLETNAMTFKKYDNSFNYFDKKLRCAK
jgi:hypothetical protein